jgi:hypothetical protein
MHNHRQACDAVSQFVRSEKAREFLETNKLYEKTIALLLRVNILSEFTSRIDDLFMLYNNYCQGIYVNYDLLQRIYDFIESYPDLEGFMILNQYQFAYHTQSLLSHYEKVNFMKIRVYENTYVKYIPRLP